MKKYYLFIVFFTSGISFAQDARIFANTWYLTNVIDNGVNNYPPNTNMYLDFYNSPSRLTTRCCNTLMANITFDNNITSFLGTNFMPTLDFCNDVPAQNYQNVYFPFFDQNNPWATRYFTYLITETATEKNLIINSAFNKQAIYSNIHLANMNFEKIELSLSPNPTTDFLEIKLGNEIVENTTVLIYNEIGAICKTENLNAEMTKIDTRDLSSGIYFIKFSTDNETVTRKFIKL